MAYLSRLHPEVLCQGLRQKRKEQDYHVPSRVSLYPRSVVQIVGRVLAEVPLEAVKPSSTMISKVEKAQKG